MEVLGAYFAAAALKSANTSKVPVPHGMGRPITIAPLGVVRVSKSPCNEASDMKIAELSYVALRSGEGRVAIPTRLKAL